MEPRIEESNEKKLIGKKIGMSFGNNKTLELWKSFSPRKKEITNAVNSNLFAVHVYNDTKFFVNFNPLKEFDSWAAIEVSDFDTIPKDLENLVITKGKYAVFQYKGKPSEAQATFQYIYGKWLPDSVYEMDNRPYFALMGDKYKGEDYESEEEFWVPIKLK
jgi:AraC family transcriptional regulator